MTHLVVFIGGAGQVASVWNDQADRVAPHMALRFSPTDLAEPFALRGAVARLHERVSATGATSVSLVGLSLGGMIATRYASAHPGLVDGLLLSGSQVRPNPVLMRLQHTILRLIPARSLGLPAGLDKRTLLSLITTASAIDLREDLPRIAAPTLVLCGSKDPLNLPAARALANGVPNGELRTIQGGGHELATDAPHDFADAVVDLLTRTGHT